MLRSLWVPRIVSPVADAIFFGIFCFEQVECCIYQLQMVILLIFSNKRKKEKKNTIFIRKKRFRRINKTKRNLRKSDTDSRVIELFSVIVDLLALVDFAFKLFKEERDLFLRISINSSRSKKFLRTDE